MGMRRSNGVSPLHSLRLYVPLAHFGRPCAALDNLGHKAIPLA